MNHELRGVHRTGHVFSSISCKMAAQGFSRTPEQCQTRLKRVKSSFRQCYENKYVRLQRGKRLMGEFRMVCIYSVCLLSSY